MTPANGYRIPDEDVERAEAIVDAIEGRHADLFEATLENVRVIGGDESMVNIVSVLAQSVVDLRRVLVAGRPDAPAPELGDGLVRRIRDVDLQRLSDLASAVSDSSLLSDEEAGRVFEIVFFDALEDPYGTPGRHWALQVLLNLTTALMTREMTVRAARDEVDVMEALRSALDEISRGEV